MIGRVLHPNTFCLVATFLYLATFIHSPLGWYSNVFVDFRYLDVYVVFIIVTLAAVKTGQMCGNRVVDPDASSFLGLRFHVKLRELVFLCTFSILAFIAILIKSDGLPLFSVDPSVARRDFTQALGGFTYYLVLLVTPLTIAAALEALYGSRRFLGLVFAILLFIPNVLLVNRQEIVMIVLVVALVAISQSRKFKLILLPSLIIGILVAAYLLGFVQVWRAGGSDAIARNIHPAILPFIVFLGDLTGTIKLGHLVADSVGPSGLPYYVFGVFLSVFVERFQDHGANFVQLQFTTAQTAQSIPAPLSYYLEGGLLLVIVLMAIQGLIIGILFRIARLGSIKWQAIYFFYMMAFLWTLRSGTVLFSPIFLFQGVALYSLLGGDRVGSQGHLDVLLRTLLKFVVIFSFLVSLSRI